LNTFDRKLNDHSHYPLTAEDISTLQVNLGYQCNLACSHCHVEGSPKRDEIMPLNVMLDILDILRKHDEITSVDITGGSPELNPNFKFFVTTCKTFDKKIIVRTNLAIYSEPGMEDMPEFLAAHKVKIVASLPCYSEEGVDSQRGPGTYRKAIEALKTLNALGYGSSDGALEIDIMFNPAGAAIAPDQQMLEKAYREHLGKDHGIHFNRLIALSNMPIGRLGKALSEAEKEEFMNQLEEKFNPSTIPNLMCRHLISVSPDGSLFDCDFWQVLTIPVMNGSTTVHSFDLDLLKKRKIVTSSLCFLCTAGAGASCSGALT